MTGNAVKSIYLTEAAQKEGRKRIMEKDLKDKKPAENGTPKVPWPKLIPAAAVIAALVFSGIKAQGSDESTESVPKADSTVMSASELEKYFGYEEETSVSGASTADNKKSSTPKKTTSKKSTKKTAAKKSSGKRTVSESAKNSGGAAGQGSTQTPVADVPANGYKDGVYEGTGTGFGVPCPFVTLLAVFSITSRLDLMSSICFENSSDFVLSPLYASRTPVFSSM